MNGQACCTPTRKSLDGGDGSDLVVSEIQKPAIGGGSNIDFGLRTIPGGMGLIGTDRPQIAMDEERPCRRKKIRPFQMMTTAVTNRMFDAFVADTGYVTEAETLGWSYVFRNHLPKDQSELPIDAGAPWWCGVDGAMWRLINGPGSDDDRHPEHPVVHISWNDTIAFANWAGGRLPTEAEWEHAARGGRGDVAFPWGEDEPNDGSFQPCNIWQGRFPENNLALDGWKATAPARSFEPNGYGLYNLCGNTWEWTADPYKVRSLSRQSKAHAQRMRGTKVLKGGSFLCHKSYCFRYRIAARTGTTQDSTTAHQGFRLVFDLTN